MGDLKSAEIYILTLNPGYSATDYFGEYCVRGYRGALLRNLRQDYSPQRSLNLFLDPQFAWSGGFGYWHTRLRNVIDKHANERGWSYAKARSKLGSKLAIIELVPYHSASFRDSLKRGLKSTKLAEEFVGQYVSNRLKNKKAIAILHRRPKEWREILSLTTNASERIFCEESNVRNPSFKPSSQFGKAILKQLQS